MHFVMVKGGYETVSYFSKKSSIDENIIRYFDRGQRSMPYYRFLLPALKTSDWEFWLLIIFRRHCIYSKVKFLS